MSRAVFVVNALRTQGIEVGRTTADVKLSDGTFPAGSFVVKRDQPYGRLAKILLEKQDFPDPNLRTYDYSGWTMGLLTGTDVCAIKDKALLDLAVEPVKATTLAGTVAGSATAGAGDVIAVAANGSTHLITLRFRLKDLAVQAAERRSRPAPSRCRPDRYWWLPHRAGSRSPSGSRRRSWISA